jgi:DNA methyltransferase 1-associated protein 1
VLHFQLTSSQQVAFLVNSSVFVTSLIELSLTYDATLNQPRITALVWRASLPFYFVSDRTPSSINMSSNDVRDVLNIPGGAAGPRPSKKQKLSAPRPNLKGLAREVQNLGGDNPIAIVPEVTHFKKRRLANRKPAARWELRPFKNSGRDDSTLILRHWKRKEDKPSSSQAATENLDAGGAAAAAGGPEGEDATKAKAEEIEDSAFAQYNVQVSVPQYSDDQYQQSLKSENWSKEETDYLMELVKEYDLRWPVIWDRYEWNPPATNGVADDDGDESKAIVPAIQARAMEDLKARYYEVAAKMMALQKPVQYMSQPEFALHELMAHFNPQQEKLRKEFALNSLTRSREEAREEESLLLEIKRILARSERFNEERRELYNRLDYPRTETDISNFKSSAGLQSLLQNLMTADKTKKRKYLLGTDAANQANASAQQPAAQEASRRESTAASTGHRDSTSAPTPTTATNKKGQQQAQEKQTPTERPKLTEKEELIYGVTHHDRLGSGPTFRTEKINKLFTHKSNQQQQRINNALNELDVPSKLVMPTVTTMQQYELLLGAVNSLLDARKVSDKLDGEIKIELAKKAERERINAPSDASNTEGKTGAEKEEQKDNEDEADEEEGEEPSTAAEAAGNGDETARSSKNSDDNLASETPAEATDAGTAADADADDKNDDEEGEKQERTLRPGSSGASHKRSASVLSATSDKSNKRQKK